MCGSEGYACFNMHLVQLPCYIINLVLDFASGELVNDISIYGIKLYS